MSRVRVEVDIPGQGTEAHEFEHCPIKRDGAMCPIGGGECKFGLTENSPPQLCPMRSGKFTQEISMRFSIVDSS